MSRTAINIGRRKGRPSNRDGVRQEIIEAAVGFLKEHPIGDLTVEKLMELTSRGRSSFYAYFKDLYHLMETLLKMVWDEVRQASNPWLQKAPDNPVTALRETMKAVTDILVHHGPIICAVLEAAPLDHKLGILWQSYTRWDMEAVETAIGRDQKTGLIDICVGPETVYALNCMSSYYLVNAFKAGKDPKIIVDTLFYIWSRILYGKPEFFIQQGDNRKKLPK